MWFFNVFIFFFLDKAQLLEIAKANAAAMCAKSGVPLPPSLMPMLSQKKDDKASQKSSRDTLKELTEVSENNDAKLEYKQAVFCDCQVNCSGLQYASSGYVLLGKTAIEYNMGMCRAPGQPQNISEEI